MLPQTMFPVAANPECPCPPTIVSYEGTPEDGDILVFNETTGQWEPAAPNPGDITAVNTTLPLTGGATSGSVTLDINNFTGDSGSGGLDGAVPAPAAGDTAAGKFLKADGTWAVPAGGPGYLSYVALVNGSNLMPTPLVFHNTIGAIVWVEDPLVSGYWVGTLAGAFPPSKTFVLPLSQDSQARAIWKVTSGPNPNDMVAVKASAPFSVVNLTDGDLNDGFMFEIRVYP